MVCLYGRAGRLTVEIGGFRPGQLHRPHLAPAVVAVEVTVENVGAFDGDEVVLVMVKPPPASLDEGLPSFSLPHSRLYGESL